MQYDFNYTYSACTTAFTPVATPTDIFTIEGNATTNVYVMRMGISTVQGTAGINEWFLLKRSAANTAAGTFTNPAKIPFNSGNTAAAAVVKQFSTNPTPGASLGSVWHGFVNAPVLTTAGIGQSVLEINFEDMFGQPICLNSASEILALNFNGAAVPAGLSVIAYVVWAEKSKT